LETVAPFRAWRYAPSAGDPARLVAPPYDVIDAGLQSRLYAADPHNVVRIDLGIATPSDNECDNQYTRAAAQITHWKETGILVRDVDPAITFVEESFADPDGRRKVRHGFLAALRLHDFEDGVILPHEETLTGPKEDRFRLITATAMNLSPIFFLYELPGDEITRAWQAGVGTSPPSLTVGDDKGTVTSLWPTADPILLRELQSHLTGARFIIADGHHRYETALRHRDLRLSEQAGNPEGRQACAYCLAYLTNMADPALAIYANHRLLAGVDQVRLTALPGRLAEWFSMEKLADHPTSAAEARTTTTAFLLAHPRKAFVLWRVDGGDIQGLILRDRAMDQVATTGHSTAYRKLDATILQTLILEKGLGITASDLAAERYVTYCKDMGEAADRLLAGEFQAGLFMNPTGLDQVREIAWGGERMPQKATFFYPKLPTGLVFQDLSGEL
jgi:uncharacterized protein (DUF1015 family)